MPASDQRRSRPGMAFRGQAPQSEFGNHGWLGDQLVAAAQGAFDGATWGQGDKVYAGLGALLDVARGQPWDYQRRIEREKARDAFYEQHYGTARTLGEIGGAFAPIPGTGVLGAGVKLLSRSEKFTDLAKVLHQIGRPNLRIKQASPLTLRERAFISGAGATTGAVGQLYADARSGSLSSARDYAAAMTGAALQAQTALHARPMVSGAAGGAATSVLQDIFDGRQISGVNAAEAAGAGSGAAIVGNAIGNNRFYRRYGKKDGEYRLITHGNKDKENMGEMISILRSRISGDKTASTKKIKLPLIGGGATVPDQVTELGKYIESKAGIYARLTRRQLQAFAELGHRYRVDHLLPRDIGAAYGFLAAQGAYRLPSYFHQDQK